MRRSVLLALSVCTGLLAVGWPYVTRFTSSGDSGCPLGFGGAADGAASPHRPASSSQPALVLYTNATVWTGDAAVPHAQAFLVDAATGRFSYVGERAGALAAAAAAASSAAPPHLQEVDLGGAHVIPGLIDSHLHLIPGGLSLSRLNLAAAGSRREFVGAVAAAAARLQPGQWLLGGGWDESHCCGGEMPTAAWIDAVTDDTPAWLLRHDAHMGLANSAALRAAGISAATPDPPGGAILRGPDAQPTGLLTDAAMQLVASAIPPLSLEERRQALGAAARHALSKGITTVHDLGRIAFMEGEEAAWQDLEEIYVPAVNAGRLPLRVVAFVALPTWRRMAERVRHLGRAHPSGMLFWGGVKEFADGSLGSRTALFHAPYADDPGTAGTLTIPLDRLRQLVAAAHGAGLQVAVHAIGDRAVDEVAAMYAELAANQSASAAQQAQQAQLGRGPHRVEHAQHIGGLAAAARLAASGIAVTPNPAHLLADRQILVARLGPQRAGAGHTYAFKTLMEAGVTSAFGSDWPVVALEPLAETLHAAVHRQAAGSGDAAWAPEEALTVAQALAAHTAAGAAAAGLERELGRIQPGMLADFAVLSGPPGAAAGVQQTFVGGVCRFDASTRAWAPGVGAAGEL